MWQARSALHSSHIRKDAHARRVQQGHLPQSGFCPGIRNRPLKKVRRAIQVVPSRNSPQRRVHYGTEAPKRSRAGGPSGVHTPCSLPSPATGGRNDTRSVRSLPSACSSGFRHGAPLAVCLDCPVPLRHHKEGMKVVRHLVSGSGHESDNDPRFADAGDRKKQAGTWIPVLFKNGLPARHSRRRGMIAARPSWQSLRWSLTL